MVIGILLVALGIPLWLVVGALGASFMSRKRFQSAPGVFKCKVRRESGAFPGLKADWPRMPGYARWVHDVLVVHAGIALVRNLALPVAAAEEASGVDTAALKGLGDQPTTIRLRLDDGSAVSVAAPAEALALLPGPSAAAQPVGLAAS